MKKQDGIQLAIKYWDGLTGKQQLHLMRKHWIKQGKGMSDEKILYIYKAELKKQTP